MRCALCMLLLLATLASGQDSPKTEFHTLYLHGQIDAGLSRQDPAIAGRFASRRPHHGFSIAHVTNFSSISGLKLEVSWMWDSHNVQTSTGSFTYRQTPLWLLAGTQIKRNRNSALLQPFFHLMGGALRYGMHTDEQARLGCADALGVANCPARFEERRWTRAQVYGGGLDIRVSEKLDLRLIHVDYVPLSRFGKTLYSVRFGTGFSFR